MRDRQRSFEQAQLHAALNASATKGGGAAAGSAATTEGGGGAFVPLDETSTPGQGLGGVHDEQLDMVGGDGGVAGRSAHHVNHTSHSSSTRNTLDTHRVLTSRFLQTPSDEIEL